MPFRSKAQMRFLYAEHPDIAKRWAAQYPDPKDLPEHVHHYLKKRHRQKKKAQRKKEMGQ